MSTSGQPSAEKRQSAARLDWERRVGQRRDSVAASIAQELPAPDAVQAEPGGGQVTLRWSPVPGAAGYVVQRADMANGTFQTIDHGGGDVLAVPGPSYADTTGRPGIDYWYSVASLSSADGSHGEGSTPLRAAATRIAGRIDLEVDAGHVIGRLARPWRMLGAEHLSQLFYGPNDHGIEVGAEFAEALRLAREELGVDRIRAHGILLDELAVYSERDGTPHFDFDGVDRVYDRLLQLGLRPVVELSFMPAALARDPKVTVFDYRAIISPPKSWERWHELVGRLARHLVERYGLDEVASWGFEVWNEPNLEVFWSGTRAEYFRLYDEAAAAIKAVDHRLLVGGPATAAAGWIGDFASHLLEVNAPLDFFATHTYGNLPLDVAATAADVGYAPKPMWWTEWGVSPRHFAPINDSVLAGPFVLHGMFSALQRAEYLAYWVVSDHFEELGHPPSLLHGGFGLLTVGNLRKPRYWAIRMLQLLGPQRVATSIRGDGAGSLVEALAATGPDGLLQILVWNGTLDQTKADGATLLGRTLKLRVAGLRPGRYRQEHLRVDAGHSNVTANWASIGSPDWPNSQQWATLHERDRLDPLVEPAIVDVDGGGLSLEFQLPMPAMSLLRLSRQP
jgi:xylan 1,4-beta-xylosidase